LVLQALKCSISTLKVWAKRIEKWHNDSQEVFVYFNNDPEASAVVNAKQLRNLIENH